MVKVGVIGLGSTWSRYYQSALESLKQRIALRAVYDPVFNKASLTIENIPDCLAATGLLALAKQPDIGALLVLDSAWYGSHALELVSRAQKPIFVGCHKCLQSTEIMQTLHRRSVESGQPIMPQLKMRYTPASGRLQELLATQLGRPQMIRITGTLPAHVDLTDSDQDLSFLTELFDWCCYIARAPAATIRSQVSTQAGHGAKLQHQLTLLVDLDATRAACRLPAIQIELNEPTADTDSSNNEECLQNELHLTKEIDCEQGQAIIHNGDGISWEAAGQRNDELLSAERPAEELMLDLFCRRVVGGLVPIADLSDVCRSLAMVAAARQSLKTGRGIAVTALQN